MHVRRVGDGAEICRLPAPGSGETDPLFSPDGRLLAVAYPGRGRVWVYRLGEEETSGDRKTLGVLAGKEPARVLDEAWRGGWCFSADSRLLALQQGDDSIAIFDVGTAKSVQHLAPVGANCYLAFNPRGRQLALSCADGIQVLDLQTGKVVWKQRLSGRGAWVEWSPDGKTLAVCEWMFGSDIVTLWDVGAGKQIGTLEMEEGGARFAFNHAGAMLASNGWSGILRLWNPLSNEQLFHTHTIGTTRPLFSEDDRFLAARELENKLCIWAVAAGDEYRTLTADPKAGKRRYACSAVSADGHLLAGGGGGSSPGVGVWDLSSGKLLAFDDSSNFVLWGPSGALLTMGRNGLFRRPIRRDPATGVVHVGAPEKLPVPGAAAAFAQSADGRVLASAQFQGAVVLHADQPDRLIPLGPQTDVRHVAVSPYGQWVATGGFGHPGGAMVWEAQTGRLEKDMSDIGCFCQVVFSPDGKRLLTCAGITHQIRVWQVGSWTEVPMTEPLQGVSPAFSPDGKLLIVETGAGVARLLDPESGKEFARLEDPSQDRADHFTFSPDGTKLVTASGDGACLHVWDLRALRRQLADMGLDWD